jgi:hypothetical protein
MHRERREMPRRLLVLAVAGALGAGAAVGISACGGDDTTTDEIAPVQIDNTTTEVTEPTVTTETTETTETATDDSGGGSSGSGGYGY